MPRSKEIPEDVKENIIFYHKSGKGYKAISKIMGLHRSTVRTIISKWKTLGTVMNLPRSGRPTKISPRTQRKLIQEVTKKPEITSKELQASLASAKIKVHDSTIRRRLGQIKKREIVSKRKTLQKKKINACDLFENNQTILYYNTIIIVIIVSCIYFWWHCVHTKLSIVIYMYIQLSICILLFLIYLFFLLYVYFVLSLSFCCTAVASVTKTNSSYV